MKKYFSRLMAILAIAVSVSCQKENQKGSNYGDLAIFWGDEAYTVEAGQSVAMAFTVVGTEGAAVKCTASVNDADFLCRIKVNPDYTGIVTVTAPDIVLRKKNLSVMLKVVDNGHGREASQDVPLTANKSEDLSVAFAADIKSMAARPGSSFEIPFVIKGLASATLVNKSVTLSGDWLASTTWPTEAKPTGIIRVTAPSALTNALNVKINVTDDYSRSAQLDETIGIVPVEPAAGAANSFIVAPGSSLTIHAVKGNSTEELDFDNAGLVWQDNRGMVASVSGNGTEKAVVVNLNAGKAGNAVVCARKGSEIVWSWHLWVIDYDPMDDPFVWTNTDNVSFTFMDRNLGAMSCAQKDWKSFGLFYQWGRKDPFVSSVGMDSSVEAKMYDLEGNEVEVQYLDRPVTEGTGNNLALAIAHPETFLTCVNSNLPRDWYASRSAGQNNDLWGGVSGFKSIYDPCPEGWTVPAAGDPWKFRFQYEKQGSLTDSKPYNPDKPWYIDDESVGFRYRTPANKEYWFPFPGKREVADGFISGVGGGAQIHTRSTSQTYCVVESFAWGNPSSEFQLNRPYGSSIRCIKE